VSRAPNRDRSLQTTGACFGKPDHPPSKVAINYGNFDEAFIFESPQITRKRRLLESGAAREGAERVVR
jgi:hypothetical protein